MLPMSWTKDDRIAGTMVMKTWMGQLWNYLALGCLWKMRIDGIARQCRLAFRLLARRQKLQSSKFGKSLAMMANCFSIRLVSF